MSSDAHYLRKELYDLMKEDSSILEFLGRGSLDGIWYWDLENPENEWMSPQFWATLGYDPEGKKHLASEWQDLIHPDDLNTAIENFNKHCADPKHPYDQVVRYRHKNGSTVWVRCRGTAIRDESGKPVRMLGAHNDLTQLKQAQEDLIKERDQAQRYLNTVEAIIVALDREGRITLINQKGCRLLGGAEDDLTGQHWFSEFLPQPDGMEIVHPIFLRLVNGETEAAEYFENPIITRKGELRQIAWHNSLLRDDEGWITGILSAGEDITERKKAEEALKRLNVTLEQRITERTEALQKTVLALEAEVQQRQAAQEQLKLMTIKSLEAMESDRKSLSKEIHDRLGGTLAAIKFQLETRISRMKTSEDYMASGCMSFEEIVSHLKTSIQEIKRISNQLRSRTLDDHGIKAALTEHIKQFKQFYPAIDVTFNIEIADQGIPTDIQTVLYRVTQEALNNIGKHSHAIQVNIKLVESEDRISLKIEDNGCGFDATNLPDTSDTLQGYGMHSMKERVELCSGTFQVQTEPGQGTSIQAVIPRQSIS